MLTEDRLEKYEHFIDLNTGDVLQHTARVLLEEIRTLQQQNKQLVEALELAMPIVEHQSPTRSEEIKRLLGDSP